MITRIIVFWFLWVIYRYWLISFAIGLYFALYWRFCIEYSTLSSIYLACFWAASCFSCLVGIIPSYLCNSFAASLIIVFIVLQFARCSIDGCMPLFAFLIRQFCSHVVISYISRVVCIYIASKLDMSFLLSIMLRF